MKTRTLTTAVVAAGVAVTVVATLTAAPDARAPRIVAAAMQDTDGDSRADRMRLTYSERVRHAADRDGKYPFRVAGYRIRSVGKASGRTIVLSLADRRPSTTRRGPSVSATPGPGRPGRRPGAEPGRRAALPRDAAHGNRPAGTPPTPTPTPPPHPAPRDSDGDGVVDAPGLRTDGSGDQAGRAGRPDLRFVDSNCDGIDGDRVEGDLRLAAGARTRTRARSRRRSARSAAVVSARQPLARTSIAAVGTYARVEVATGVAIYGGYDAKTWKRGFADDTVIEGMPEGVFADKATGVVLQLLTVNARDSGLGTARASTASAPSTARS